LAQALVGFSVCDCSVAPDLMGCTSAKPAAAPSAVAAPPRDESTASKAVEQNSQSQQRSRDEDVSTTDTSIAATKEVAPDSLDANGTVAAVEPEPVLWEWGEPDDDEDEGEDPRNGLTQSDVQCPKCSSANSTLLEVTIGATHEGWGGNWKDCKYHCVKCNKEMDPGVTADCCRKCKCFWHRKNGCDEVSQMQKIVEEDCKMIVPEQAFPVVESGVMPKGWCCG